MKILIYHAGFIGDVIVCGQNFALELSSMYKKSTIDIMIQPKVSHIKEIIEPLKIFNNIILGDEHKFNSIKNKYDKHYIMDGNVYPEGNLRTAFVKSGIPFKIHRLSLSLSQHQKELASEIVKGISGDIIIMQDDMHRKWNNNKAYQLRKKLEKIATVISVGPEVIHNNHNKPLTFLESVALIQKARIFIGIDSGIAHGAALIGTQTILIPPVFPESWISPTEYANLYTDNKHISIRPPKELFCGHYFCLQGTSNGGIKDGCGNPLVIKCSYNKKYFILKTGSCFSQISVDDFFNTITAELGYE